ncbi:MAG: hypothetical protein PHH37_04465 [Paludibacter sp.]|nr:hypothetical protein [Paludibacter sp.]
MKNVLILLFCSWVGFSLAQEKRTELNLNGQLVGWTTAQFVDPFILQPGGRFVPVVTGKYHLVQGSFFDMEASLNVNGNTTFENWKYAAATGEIKPYRVWLRYAGEQFEVRAGLQKINFGSAKMFRPLMWFDGMDVRDPLQLTDGVYGLLGKYFFKNNANIWLWGLIGNKNTKGWETNATEQWKPELGGRIQIPVATGEMALSTNFRQVKVLNPLAAGIQNVYENLAEKRIGLDGKWDAGVGLWFENSTTITQKNNIQVPQVQDMWNAGMDYTFAIGNGLGATLEYLRYHAGNDFLVNGYALNLIGSMFTYPVSLMDNLSLMLFYVPGQNLVFNYASWARTYDNLSLYVIGFWNPENVQLLSAQSQSKNLFAGKGVQVMVSYNF